ncbi:MAG: glutathione S-transferase C-terminal domain-containing protein, partial [Pseudomonadota bacterium]
IVLGSAGDNLPPDFAADRGRLYLGENWAQGLKAANAELPHLVSQVRAPFAWLDRQLGDGRDFLLGSAPAAIDAQVYHVVWFLHGRWDQGSTFLSEFLSLERWRETVCKIGHGSMADMSPQDAIERARACEPVQIEGRDGHDPQGLEPGMLVTISPDLDGGEQPVAGEVVAVNSATITVHRSEPETGSLHVHFPRAGYKVKPV